MLARIISHGAKQYLVRVLHSHIVGEWCTVYMLHGASGVCGHAPAPMLAQHDIASTNYGSSGVVATLPASAQISGSTVPVGMPGQSRPGCIGIVAPETIQI